MRYCLNFNCQNPQNPIDAEVCQNCGSKLLLDDRYLALKLIDQGGFGRTFLAVDEFLPTKPRCVIKQFFPGVSAFNYREYELASRRVSYRDMLAGLSLCQRFLLWSMLP